MSAYPRGRPKKKRIESLVKPKKLRKCGKCKQMVDDHDARTCKGIGEVPASLHQHHRMAFDQARGARPPAATEHEELELQDLDNLHEIPVPLDMDNLDEIPAAVAVEVPVRTRRTRRTREPSTVTASTVSSRLKRRKMRK